MLRRIAADSKTEQDSGPCLTPHALPTNLKTRCRRHRCRAEEGLWTAPPAPSPAQTAQLPWLPPFLEAPTTFRGCDKAQPLSASLSWNDRRLHCRDTLSKKPSCSHSMRACCFGHRKEGRSSPRKLTLWLPWWRAPYTTSGPSCQFHPISQKVLAFCHELQAAGTIENIILKFGYL